jgi:hypothetical protein
MEALFWDGDELCKLAVNPLAFTVPIGASCDGLISGRWNDPGVTAVSI